MINFRNNLDEIVFAGRNKEYGAYLLRKRYPRVMIISTLLSFVIAILFFAFILYESVNPTEEAIFDEQNLVIFSPMNAQSMDKLMPPPPKMPEKKPPLVKPDEIIKEIATNYEIVDSVTEIVEENEIPTILITDTVVDELNNSAPSDNNSNNEYSTGSAFYIVDEMPEFPGGEPGLRAAIARNIRYPYEAYKNNRGGVVHVSFVVKYNGLVENVSVVHGNDSLLNKEAVRVIQELPAWKPGKQHGKAVSVWYSVPINFQFQ
ncbi:MAG TPA: hypothetical protein DCQ31_06390 [Bacteroidales bacterium]|nr:hypothetical protein [Bacteroidales bacterium]